MIGNFQSLQSLNLGMIKLKILTVFCLLISTQINIDPKKIISLTSSKFGDYKFIFLFKQLRLKVFDNIT